MYDYLIRKWKYQGDAQGHFWNGLKVVEWLFCESRSKFVKMAENEEEIETVGDKNSNESSQASKKYSKNVIFWFIKVQ